MHKEKTLIAPGIYFHLDEEEYRADPALGSTDLKNLLFDPLVYWTYSPLNPNRQPRETSDLHEGRVKHLRILEGRKKFRQTYVPRQRKEDFDELLDTNDDLRGWLKSARLPTNGNKPDLIKRVLDEDPEARIWQMIKDQFEHWCEEEGKVPTSDWLLEAAEYNARFVEENEEAAKLFCNGYPEVSIFWEEEGIRCKARIDYLKARAAVDYKTYTNNIGTPIEKVLHNQMASYGYDLQAAHYMRGLDALQNMSDGIATDTDDHAFVGALLESPGHTFWFVFQMKGPAPLVTIKEFPRRLIAYENAMMKREKALNTWVRCAEKFGLDQVWKEDHPPSPFDDESFPMWMR